MKTIALTIFLIFAAQFKSNAQDHFLGFWANEDDSQIIKIYKKEKLYYGDIIYRKDKSLKDIINRTVLFQLKKKNKKILYGGIYFDHNLSKEYEVTLTLKDEKNIILLGIYDNKVINQLWHKVPR